MSDIPEQHKRFADEYLIDLDGKAAYIRAGYKAKGNAAEVNASRLLRNAKVQEYLECRRRELEKRTDITQDRIMKEYAKLGFFDPRKMFDDKGNPLGIHDLDDDTAAAIAGLDVQEVYEGFGEDRTFVGYVKKWKLADKKAALDSMARTLGMFKDNVNVKGEIGLRKLEDFLT